MMPTSAGSVHEALAALARGQLIVVTDDVDRENEGDLVGAAELITAEQMAFIVRHSTGIVCAPMTTERADALQLPLMVADNTDTHQTAFTVTVDHTQTGTGVSAADRAATVRALADVAAQPDDFHRPGHIFPLRARAGGVLVRAGHTEAATDLLPLAGLAGVGVISEITDDDGTMRSGQRLREFGGEHQLPILAIADLVRYRRDTEQLVTRVAAAAMPTEFGDFRAIAYRSEPDGIEHLALIKGDVAAAGRSERGVLVRVHSECLTGDILGSLRCDCGAQLEQALRAISTEGCGIVVYLRGHEGRGVGLANKIRAYALQEQGLDTVDANLAQGLPVDARDYAAGAQILKELGARRIRLITNNPAKFAGLGAHAVTIVERLTLPTITTAHNVRYLRTKQTRLGHDITFTQQCVSGI